MKGRTVGKVHPWVIVAGVSKVVRAGHAAKLLIVSGRTFCLHGSPPATAILVWPLHLLS